jgi:orotate phosphoribosyltransferase
MTRDELLDVYRRSGALLDGHFRLTSGLHSPGYLQCALVLQHPQQAESLGRAIADRVRDLRPTVVLSPALGGIVIGQEVGRALGVRAIFAGRQDGSLVLRRGFTIHPADRVLVVEDVMTTGGSTRETIDVAKAAGGQVVGAASIVDRSPSTVVASQVQGREPRDRPAESREAASSGQVAGTLRFDVPFITLLRIDLPTYEPADCPLCAEGLAVVKPGSRSVAV